MSDRRQIGIVSDVPPGTARPVSYIHLRAHETVLDLVCRLLLEKKNKNKNSDTLIVININTRKYHNHLSQQ